MATVGESKITSGSIQFDYKETDENGNVTKDFTHSLQGNFIMTKNNKYDRTFCYMTPNGYFAVENGSNDTVNKSPTITLIDNRIKSNIIPSSRTSTAWGFTIGGQGVLALYPSEFDARNDVSNNTALHSSLKDLYPTEIFTVPSLGVGRNSQIAQNMLDNQYGFYVDRDSYIKKLTCTSLEDRTPSDIKLKTISNKPNDYVSTIKSLGDVVSYRYNTDKEFETLSLDTGEEHTGLIYQNAVKAGIPKFTGETKDGYGWINYISPDYQAILLGAVQQLIKRVETLEDKVK